MTGPINSDEGTRTNLINAFITAWEEGQNANNMVNNAGQDLAGIWTGESSSTFGGGLETWMQGLRRVQDALNSIQDGMVNLARLTTSTEDENIVAALADPTPLPTGSSWT